jgi:tRNA-uridine 2-sulfurtransferase
MPKVILGMSGGVDSSVSAYLLKKEGYDVEGVSFILWDRCSGADRGACCTLQAAGEAEKAARFLDMPHTVVDVRDEFSRMVIAPFVDMYVSGLTPNPCILCNRFIKFPFLIKNADESGADFISTGHYARVDRIQDSKSKIRHSEDRLFSLKKAVDTRKDQSYVLYVLTQDMLKRLILPLGDYKKDEVRKIAKETGLPAAHRPESQEICFVQDRKYISYIESLSAVAAGPGPIVDTGGKVIGKHAGIYGYTIGQRKGMGISSAEPLYVIDIDVLKNTVYAGPREAAMKKEFFVDNLNWINPLPVFGDREFLRSEDTERVATGFRVSVKVRSMMNDAPAAIFIETTAHLPRFAGKAGAGLMNDVVRVVFDEPQWAPAPGQSAVFYDGEDVIGGGVISRRA